MKKEEFYFNSNEIGRKIHAVRYTPDTEPRAVFQITHGMVEYIERYEEFAEFLCKHGFVVTGHDHLGHGGSIVTRDDYGFFAENDGNEKVLDDIHTLTLITKELYPALPYFLLGHSMGSFYARQYLCKYGYELTGAVIMGTGFQAKFLVNAGIAITKFLMKIKGSHYRCEFVNNMAFGGYNKKFEPARTKYDWLSKNEASVDAYAADERCTFTFTLNGYYNMFTGIARLYDDNFLAGMPKNLPVLMVSGEDDPVGEFSEGVKRAYESIKGAGVKDVRLKLYPNMRHEILNEPERQEVYDDILAFLNDVLSSTEARRTEKV